MRTPTSQGTGACDHESPHSGGVPRVLEDVTRRGSGGDSNRQLNAVNVLGQAVQTIRGRPLPCGRRANRQGRVGYGKSLAGAREKTLFAVQTNLASSLYGTLGPARSPAIFGRSSQRLLQRSVPRANAARPMIDSRQPATRMPLTRRTGGTSRSPQRRGPTG